MNRSHSPVHLHVNRKAPVHLHVSSSSSRPDGKLQFSTNRRMRASEWVKASTSKGPWIPPPGKTKRQLSTNRMSWEGPTHCLEIEPVYDGEGTCLHVSDLDGANGTTDIILEPAGGDGTQSKLDNLTAEVNSLRNELELHRFEQKEHDKSLKKSPKEAKQHTANGTLCKLEKELDDVTQINSNRESLLQSITEAELDLNSVNRQIDLVKESLRLLLRDKSLSPSRARDATENGTVLQDRLGELQMGLKVTKQLLRSQQLKESKIRHYSEEIETLQHCLLDSQSLVHSLKEELADKEKLAVHSHQLHKKIKEKENEIKELLLKVQSLKEEMKQKHVEYDQLESEFYSTKRKADVDRETLKRSNKQHKDKALKTEKSVEELRIQADHLTSELEIERSRCSRLSREKGQFDSNLHSLRLQLKELQDTSNECQSRLEHKVRENGTLQLENEQHKTTISALQSQIRANETSANTKISIAQSESRELQSTVTQYEGLLTDYKIQLEKSHQEIDRLVHELHEKDKEIEQLQHDSFLELEKSKLSYQKHLSEIEPLSSHLKTSEIKLQESKEKLSLYEQRNSEQNRAIAELTAKSTTVDSLKEKLQEKKSELKIANAKIGLLEKRLNECETQNREVLVLNSKKEEIIQQLQFKEENYLEEIGTLKHQLDSLKTESRKEMDDLREKTASKERNQTARQTDLETQLKRVNTQLNQMKKSKEENERKLHCKVRELQEKLDHSQATKKALESYLSFIKSSYASIFNDTSMPTWESPLAH